MKNIPCHIISYWRSTPFSIR